MSSCCNNNPTEKTKPPRKHACPVNAKEYIEVPPQTILQHIKSPWQQILNEENYYFCDDPNCKVVYFGLNGTIINKSELRTQIGIKENNENTPICYCFGVTKAQAKQNSELKSFVTRQTKDKMCACDIRNPSGRCCLKDFP